MERINQFEIYELGKTLKPIEETSGDVEPLDVVIKLLQAENQISNLLSDRPIPLEFSKSAAKNFHEAITEILDKYCSAENPDGTKRISLPSRSATKIPAWEWRRVTSALQTFEHVFDAEMKEISAYRVPQRGIYSTKDLVDSADKSFPMEVESEIPDKAKNEWRSAGRCLAFNLLTASGFHVARAVEGMLEVYHSHFSNKQISTNKTWGDYLSDLEKLKRKSDPAAPSEKTFSEIKQMKDDYRNPLMHPRVDLKEGDARMLFDNGESLIIGMAQELSLSKKTLGGVQPGLPLQPDTK